MKPSAKAQGGAAGGHRERGCQSLRPTNWRSGSDLSYCATAAAGHRVLSRSNPTVERGGEGMLIPRATTSTSVGGRPARASRWRIRAEHARPPS
jgi:hypothetical protein